MENLVIKPNELAQIDKLLGDMPFRYAAPIVSVLNQITNLRIQEEKYAEAQAKEANEKHSLLGSFSKKKLEKDKEEDSNENLGGLTGGGN